MGLCLYIYVNKNCIFYKTTLEDLMIYLINSIHAYRKIVTIFFSEIARARSGAMRQLVGNGGSESLIIHTSGHNGEKGGSHKKP